MTAAACFDGIPGLDNQPGVDLVLLGCGTIRRPSLGLIVTVKDFIEIFLVRNLRQNSVLPVNSCVISWNTCCGRNHLLGLRITDSSGFQKASAVNLTAQITRSSHWMNRKEAADDDLFTVVIQKFFFDNTQDLPDLPHEQIGKNGRLIEAAAKATDIPEEYFRDHECLNTGSFKHTGVQAFSE